MPRFECVPDDYGHFAPIGKDVRHAEEVALQALRAGLYRFRSVQLGLDSLRYDTGTYALA